MQPAWRWQFGVVHLAAAAVTGGVVTAAVTAPPSEVSGLLLAFLSFALPAACLLGIFYGRGAWRAFAVGAMIPAFEGWCLSVLAALFAATLGSELTNEATTASATRPVYAAYGSGPAATGSAPLDAQLDDDGALGGDDSASEVPPLSPDVAAPSGGSESDVDEATMRAPTASAISNTTTAVPSAASRTVGLHFAGPGATLTGFARMFRIGGVVYGVFALLLGAFCVGIYWLIHRAAAEHPDDSDRPARWQFGLRHLMGMSAIAAVISAAVTAPPTWYCGLLLGFLSLAMPAACVMGMVYGNGAWRAFSIGAALPLLEGWFLSAMAVASTAGTPLFLAAVLSFDATELDGPSLMLGDLTFLSSVHDQNSGLIYTCPIGSESGLGYAAIPALCGLFATLYAVGCGVYAIYAVALGLSAVSVRSFIERIGNVCCAAKAGRPDPESLRCEYSGRLARFLTAAWRTRMKLISRLKAHSLPLLTGAAATAVVVAVVCPVNCFTGLVLGFLSFAFPTACVLVVVYGGGYARTFGIGALVPSVEGWLVSAIAVLAMGAESAFPTTAAPPPTAATAPSPSAQGATVTATVTSPYGMGTFEEEMTGLSYVEIPDLCRQFGESFQVAGAVYWSFAVVLGLFAVAARWLVERAKAPRGSPAADSQRSEAAAGPAPSPDFTSLHAAHPTPPSLCSQTTETRIAQNDPPQ